MLLKTYRAPDLATALARARDELGPTALVLATRDVRGRLGLEAVEVTVGAPRVHAPHAEESAEPRDRTIRHLVREIESIRRTLESPGTTAAVRASVATAEPPGRVMDASGPERDPALDAAVRALIASGLSEDLANRFAAIAARRIEPPTSADGLVQAAESGIAEIVRFAPAPMDSRCLFVVGPPGAGKSTTVSKLAKRISASRGRSVVVAAFGPAPAGFEGGRDTPRVRSAEQLRELVRAAGRRGTLLLDTPGLGAGDELPRRRLAALRDAVPRADVALLVPAGLHRDEAAHVLRRFEDLRPSCVAFSRVDDATRVGELVTALCPTQLPLSFVTNGRRPGDLQEASPRRLAALMFRAGLGASRSPEMDR